MQSIDPIKFRIKDEVSLDASQLSKIGICPICSGSGWAPAEQMGTVCRCDCWKSKRLARLIAAANIPERYRECTLIGYGTDSKYPSQKDAKNLVEGFLRDYPLMSDDDIRKSVGFLFLGPCGVGKTHLAVALLRHVIEQTGESGLFYNFNDLLKEIRGSWDPVSQTSELDVLRPVMDARVLVLDELGANKPTDWVRDTLYYIINNRYVERRLTVFTSNYLDKPVKSGDETLTDRIGTPLRSRLYEMCQEVEIKGRDSRTEITKASFK